MVKDQLKVHKSKMLEVFYRFWSKYKDIGQPWLGLRNFTKDMNKFIMYGNERAIRIYMSMVTDIIQLEYKLTKSILHTSNNFFSIFNELNLQKGKEEFAKLFYDIFETEVSNTPLYANEP